MSGIATKTVTSPRYRRHMPPRPRSEAERTRIIDTAMRHWRWEQERKDDRTIVAEGSLDLRR
jgi:hypothetical protein